MDEIYNAFADPKSEHIHLENHPNVLFNKDYNDDYSISATLKEDEVFLAINKKTNMRVVLRKLKGISRYQEISVCIQTDCFILFILPTFPTFPTFPSLLPNYKAYTIIISVKLLHYFAFNIFLLFVIFMQYITLEKAFTMSK